MGSIDQTQLHSAAQCSDLEIAELLLRNGADMYFKDEKGMTPFHILLQKRVILFDSLHARKKEVSSNYSIMYREENCKALDARNIILADESQSVRLQTPAQQRSDLHANSFRLISKQEYLTIMCKKIEESGRFLVMLLKHKDTDPNSTAESKLLKFYASCTLKNTSIAEGLCDQVADINNSFCQDSPIYPGYTALHFASHCNVDLVKALVSKGANLLIPDIKGVTPLQICITSFELKDVHTILSMSPECRNILFINGKTKLTDYSFSLQNVESHKKLLSSMGLDDGVSLPMDSPIWPGYTILHLALTLLPEVDVLNLQIKKILMAYSNIVTKQDKHGSTPVHMTFRQNKLKLVELLLNHQKTGLNSLDEDNLSHLHIAAAVNNQQLTREILKNEENVNIAYKGESLPSVKPGWTPLNTAAHTNHAIITRTLLERGANLLQKDSQGLTVVHQLLGSPNKKVAQCIFGSDQLRECVVEGVGLTHLHAAVWQNDVKAIARLLESGADIEATVGQLEEKELKKFVGCRPIHVAIMGRTRLTAFEALLRSGANILAKKLDEPSPFSEILSGKYNINFVNSIVHHFWNNKTLQARIYEEMGITMLHIACYSRDTEKINELLQKGLDVNAKTRDESIIWPGFTPLHVSVTAGLNLHHKHLLHTIDELYRLLLKKGAAVTLFNAEGDTSVHMALKSANRDIGNNRAALLLQHQRDFSVNPVNKAGMSHFHVACLLNEATAVEEFLKRIPDIDVNQQISSVDGISRLAGHTPLLLTLSSRAKTHYKPESQVRVARLLLKRGADIHAADAFGYTPLHKLAACTPTRDKLLLQILMDDTDINKRTVDGTTPTEIMLLNGATSEEINYFVNCGAQINSYNPISDIGYMAIVLAGDKNKKSHQAGILKIMINSRDITEVSATGRNAIHNAITSLNTSTFEYCDIFEKLIRRGCNIFQQDIQGRTALHLAVKFKNKEALEALLECGADVNRVDSAGHSPFYYASTSRSQQGSWISPGYNAELCVIFALHLIKLQFFRLQVSNSNAKLLSEILSERDGININFKEHVVNLQLERTSKIKMCSRGFTLRDFLYATGPVTSLKTSDRRAIDSFFKRGDDKEFSELKGLLKLQYKNVLQRPSLIAPALGGLNVLLEFPLPELCAQIILTYLTNLDLKNLTAATT